MEKPFLKAGKQEANMDRSSRYINKMNEQRNARADTEAPYRDYFAELIALICGVVSHYAFRFAASVSGFVTVLLFTLGIAGGIETEVLPLACGIPLGIMLLCILALLNKARK